MNKTSMPTLSRFLSNEHSLCDDLFAEAENAVGDADWLQAGAAFQSFVAEMERHFGHEEDVLFPSFEDHTGMRSGPTQVMREEHAQMRSVFTAMDDALARKDADAYLGNSETLLMLMRQHNLKEENILYPMAEQALAGLQADLLARMD